MLLIDNGTQTSSCQSSRVRGQMRAQAIANPSRSLIRALDVVVILLLMMMMIMMNNSNDYSS